MVPITQLWLPILLSAILVFFASNLIHMVGKWHNADYRKLPNEDEVRAAIRRGAPGPGQYVLPYCMEMRELGSPEVQRKFIEGPVAMLYLKAAGLPSMGAPLGGWFLFNLALGAGIACMASWTLGPGSPALQVFRLTGGVAFLVHAGGAVPGAIWMGKPWRVAAKEAGDAGLYALATGAAFAWLWPR
jgi:hypothetical protein